MQRWENNEAILLPLIENMDGMIFSFAELIVREEPELEWGIN